MVKDGNNMYKLKNGFIDNGSDFWSGLVREINDEMLPLTNYVGLFSFELPHTILESTMNELGFIGVSDVEVSNRLIDYGGGNYEIREYGVPYVKTLNLLSRRTVFEGSRDIFMENRMNGLISDSSVDSTVFKPVSSSTSVRKYSDLTVSEKDDLNFKTSVNRSKSKVREYVLANDFKYFWTLTFSPDRVDDRYDDFDIIRRFRKWMENIRYRKCKFHYLAIPERHRDGALHFHVLAEDNCLSLVDSGLKDSSGRVLYNMPDWSVGYSSVVVLDGQKERIANYITKYMVKSFGSSKPVKPRYIASRGLLVADVYHNVDISNYDYTDSWCVFDRDTGEVRYRVYKNFKNN